MQSSWVYALVLAAGESRRFGGNKLLMVFRGKPLLSHTLDIVLQAMNDGDLSGGVVVARGGDTPLGTVARATGLDVVSSHAAEDGLSRSLQAGLSHLEATSARAVLIFVGDQPEVRADVVRTLVQGWSRGSTPILRPRYLDDPDRPGHPVLLDRSAWPLARELRGDTGLGPMLRHYPHLVTVLDVPGSNPDIDTPEDFRRLAPSL